MKLLGASSWRDVNSRKQAHWFSHTPRTPTSSSFRDSYLCEMLREIFSPNSMNNNIPVSNERSLQRHVYAKHDLMKSEIAEVIKEKCAQSQGNSFAQLIHDGSTLENGKKV